jgi:hypothetical protein
VTRARPGRDRGRVRAAFATDDKGKEAIADKLRADAARVFDEPKMMQREHRDEATGVLPATFLNEAIRQPP